MVGNLLRSADMSAPAFVYNPEMRMPDGTAFPEDARFPEGTLFYVKDIAGLWHEAKIVDPRKNANRWHLLTGRVKQSFD